MATEYKDKLSISIIIADVVDKVTKHLAVIGKRAKDVQGKSLFSDLTVSSNEKVIFNDLVKSGAETLVKELSPFCGEYTNGDNLSFIITAKRWEDENNSEDNTKNLVKALEEAIHNYLYNFTLWQYLSIIHPSTGEKYPPLYGTTYNNQCSIIISNIIVMCNLKRVPKKSLKTYADMIIKKITGGGDSTGDNTGSGSGSTTPSTRPDRPEPTVQKVWLTVAPSYKMKSLAADVTINDVLTEARSAQVPVNKVATYKIEMDGFFTKEGEVLVKDDMCLQVPMVAIEDDEDVPGMVWLMIVPTYNMTGLVADVTINGVHTNNLRVPLNEKATYKIELSGYVTKTGEILVTQETNLQVPMTPTAN